MIKPISQYDLSNRVYPGFKNSSSVSNQLNERPHFFFDKRFEKIKTDDDFRKAQLDQAERSIILSAATAFTLIACAVMFLLGRGKVTSKTGGQEFAAACFKGFETLKDNPKIPTLDTCKSINKDLLEILEMQVRQAKAGADVVKESGEAAASNRLLLFGPAGVGKSFFAKIYAKSLDAEYMEVLYSDFNSKWSGESVENLKYIFEKIVDTTARRPDKKYVVTFNEIDAIVMPPENFSRGGGHVLSKLEDRSVFLNYMELLKEKTPNVTVIGTTNISPKNNGLDKAAMSRFLNIIEVSYPDKNCLYEAMKMSLKSIEDSEKFITDNAKELQELAEAMAKRRFSFRNLENIVNQAKQYHKIDIMDGSNKGFKIDYLKKGEKSIKFSDGELDMP